MAVHPLENLPLLSTPPSPALPLMLLLGAIAAVAPLSIDMYLPALPLIASDLAASSARLQQSVAVFLFGFALCQLVYGPLSDRIGRRPVLLFGLLLFTAASAACTLVNSAEQLLLTRLLQALGGGASAVVINAVVRDRYQGPAAARVFSLVIMTMTLAPLLAPSIGSLLLQVSGWRAIFLLLTLQGLTLTLWVACYLPETLPPARRRQQPWRQLFAGYLSVLRHRQAMGHLLCSALAFAAMFAFITGSPFVYIGLFQVSEQLYGVLFGCNVLLLMAANGFNSRYVMKTGLHPMIVAGLAIQSGCGLVLMLAALSGLLTLTLTVLCCALFIGAIGLLAPNTSAAVVAPFEHHAGAASALMGSARFFCGALAAMLVALLDDGTAMPMVTVMGGCALAAAGCYAILARAPSANA
ncbi:Bcr/CflA family multidrug efflux MFS transporter [Motiliproteus sediminis]|uniref:Bcr/CflA family multidrug efflux MFS transporter n=1 Tax=Motiliproteus sediminis TaxID=1468178 RepID=UPI001AF0040C|nr:Bcr/CflA family multidrug efflux MFS transporter [Motiliproteus sediminis]